MLETLRSNFPILREKQVCDKESLYKRDKQKQSIN